jgi:hypothetical protein
MKEKKKKKGGLRKIEYRARKEKLKKNRNRK